MWIAWAESDSSISMVRVVLELGRSGSDRAWHLRRRLDELWNAHQVVGGSREGEGPVNLGQPPELGLAQTRYRLHPAERLLDPLAHAGSPGSPDAGSCAGRWPSAGGWCSAPRAGERSASVVPR